MLNPYRSDRLFSSLHALKKVAHVAAARCYAPGVAWQPIVSQFFDRLAMDTTAVDEYSPLLADEHNSIAVVSFDLFRAIITK